jgi:hypothetical protein
MNDTLIVSIDEFSMSVLEKEGFYATKKPIKEGTRFIAFYRSLPIGGITCYAEIKEVCQGDRADVGAVYWMRNFPEQELAGVVLENLPGVSTPANAHQFSSVLLDAKKTRALRIDFEEKSKTDGKKAKREVRATKISYSISDIKYPSSCSDIFT